MVLLATHTTNLTWGVEIAKTLTPEHIYEYLFLIALPGQLLFGVASMTVPAVVTAFALSELYFLHTGSYYFLGPIPSAAFLGMLLLFTDPATAPRRETGRVIYGVLYGLSVFVLAGLLERFGAPSFYDKLLFVPFLNLSVRAIDRLVERPAFARFDTARLAPGLQGGRRNLAMILIWTVLFGGIYALHGFGMHHPTSLLSYWVDACAKHQRSSCGILQESEVELCWRGSGWACNESGIRALEPGTGTDGAVSAAALLERACALGFSAGCANAAGAASNAAGLRHAKPMLADYDKLLDTRGLSGAKSPARTLREACAQGWPDACADETSALGSGLRAPVEELRQACAAGDAHSCQALGMLFKSGDGVPRDPRRALACQLAITEACSRPWIDAPAPTPP